MAELLDRLQQAVGSTYRIERELGGGGMSRVFLAEEVNLSRRVVIKVLPPEMAASVNRERFHREIQLAASLQHPHIVPLLTAGSATGVEPAASDLLYYVMPYIEGESLRAKLSREGELPVNEVVRILSEVADALSYAHDHQIVHRDIKPDNVLLSGRHAVVTDFGVAKAVSASTGQSSLTSLGVALGTPAYMAPEQAAANPHVDHRADIYALGALAYEMLAGRPPFNNANPQAVLAAHVTENPHPVTSQRPAIPQLLGDVVMRCLEKRPADRWQRAEHLIPVLESLATSSGGTTPTATAPYDASWALRRSHPLRVAGLFTLGGVAVLGIVYFLMVQLGLPGWVVPGAALLLLLGFPVMLLTGHLERRRALAMTGGGAGTAQTPAVAGTGLNRAAHRWLTWGNALRGGALAFVALALVAGGYMAMRALGIGPVGTLVASGVLESEGSLVLADFANRTSDPTLGPSVTEALRIDLAQSQVVRLLPPATIASALDRMNRPPGTPFEPQLAREVAEREGAQAIVTGEISPVGQGFVVSAQIVGTGTGDILLALRETADDDSEIIGAIDRLSERLRERIGESLKTIRAREPLERVTTGSLDALRLYTQALQADEAGDMARTISLLEDAIAVDTAFAMAYRKLAAMLGNAFAPASRILAATTKAYEHRDRLPPLEQYLAIAQYHLDVDDDPERTIDAYRSALQIDPRELTALNNLALALNGERRYAEAEAVALRGLDAATFWQLFANTIHAQVAQGKLEEADRTFQIFAQRFPDNPHVDRHRLWMAAMAQEYARADSIAAVLSTQPDPFWQDQATFAEFSLDQLRGRLREAEEHGRANADVNQGRGVPDASLEQAVRLAWIDLRFRDDPSAAVRRLDTALGETPLGSISAPDRPYVELAHVYARAGEVARARRLVAEFEREVPEGLRRGRPRRHAATGSIALAEGRLDDAIADFRAWHEEDGFCASCGMLELAQAYERMGQPDSALAAYERVATTPGLYRMFQDRLTLSQTYKRLGELHEERGDRQRAVEYYNRFVDLWRDADPELQPIVSDVKDRIARLAGEVSR